MAICIECGTRLVGNAPYCPGSHAGDTEATPSASVMTLDLTIAQVHLKPGAVQPVTLSGAAPIRANGLAVSALVVGVIALCMGLLGQGWLGILAAIHGHRARHQISESGGRQVGNGLAVGGLILGYVAIVLTVAYIGMGNNPPGS